MKNLKLSIVKKNIIIAAVAVFAVIALPLYDKKTNEYLNSSLKLSAATYTVVRSINAAVSVIQESSLSVGVGVEGNLALGQALDPVNDATERFSDLLTLSIWSLGGEKIIYEISKLPLFTFIILFLAVFVVFYNSVFLKKMLVIFIIVRLFIPFSSVISGYLNENYFSPQINKNINTLKPYIKENAYSVDKKNESFWDRFSNTFKNTKNYLAKIQEETKYYIINAGKIINALVSLASLYLAQLVLNILLLPLLLVYTIKNLKLE